MPSVNASTDAPDRRPITSLRIESVLMALGLALLAVYVVMRTDGALLARARILSFEASRKSLSVTRGSTGLRDASSVDFSLWSEKRIDSYKQSLAQRFDPPLALLRVAKIHLEVPVLEGTDDLTLNRGAGRIAGTARVGEKGNLGVAGHRDGFFRGLKDVGLGDSIDLVLPNRTDTYVVDKVEIVDPDDVGVLRPTSVSSLTLVTCYPFYFIGSAPQRYIVHASIAKSVR
jgi:sortase A